MQSNGGGEECEGRGGGGEEKDSSYHLKDLKDFYNSNIKYFTNTRLTTAIGM